MISLSKLTCVCNHVCVRVCVHVCACVWCVCLGVLDHTRSMETKVSVGMVILRTNGVVSSSHTHTHTMHQLVV